MKSHIVKYQSAERTIPFKVTLPAIYAYRAPKRNLFAIGSDLPAASAHLTK